MPPDGDREEVYCHLCRHVWYRDEHGIICPDCSSDVVEIIDPQNDPRQNEQQSPFPSDSLRNHDPWHNTAPDADDDDPVDSRSMGGRPSREIQEGTLSPHTGMHPFEALFGSMLGGNVQHPSQMLQNDSRMTRGSGWTTRTSSGRLPGGGTYNFSVASGPSWNMHYRSGGTGMNRGDTEDLSGILSNMLQFMATPNSPFTSRGTTTPPPMHPLLSLMMGPLAGNHGDAVYTQEGFDRILTMLREQHGGATGAPPASEEAIAALPKVRISQEHLDEQGKAECSICMDPVNMGEEVTILPCNHWFHGDCIKSWLVEHDTCPQCRRGITPREGPQNQPRATGQAPQYWQVNRDDLEGYVGGDPRPASTGFPSMSPSNNTSRSPDSPNRSQSTRNSLASMANSFMRRISGAGHNHPDNNNDASGNGGARHNSRSS